MLTNCSKICGLTDKYITETEILNAINREL